MKRAAALLLTVLAGACMATTAEAQSAGRFAKADVNHDGRVTLREYESFVGARLSRAKGPKAERFRQLDPEKQAALLQRRFERLDRGHKGYLEPADWQPHSQGRSG
jgi:hypothetical protein